MTKRDPFNYFETSPEIIRLAVMMYVGYSLSIIFFPRIGVFRLSDRKTNGHTEAERRQILKYDIVANLDVTLKFLPATH